MYVVQVFKNTDLSDRKSFTEQSEAEQSFNDEIEYYYHRLKNSLEPFLNQCTIRVCLKVQTDALKSISFKSH